MGRSGQVWRIYNFMTQTHPTSYKKKKKIVTQPNPPSPKNQPDPTGWVGSGRVWQVGEFYAHSY